MNPRFVFRVLAAALVLPACSSSPSPTAADAAAAPIDAAPDASATATFSYTPSWHGVQSVEVIGGFGQAGDWTTPLVTLTANGPTFTGSVQLPPGQYPYLLHVVGDADAGAQATTLSRYVFDPASTTFVACPATAPTYSATDANPCSMAALPATAPTLLHVRGKVVKDGTPAAGYLVVLEREETGSHHFFVDRMTTTNDGTYDLAAAAGTYRVQVQNPLFESKTDAQLVPDTLAAVRRNISSGFAVAADVTLSNTEVAFHDYAMFAPRTTATLPTAVAPTTFTFAPSNELPAHLEIYGTRNQGAGPEIGDPWFSGPATATGSATFNGTFTTAQASETAAASGERYFWGIERKSAVDSSGLSWTAQSMVYPITWQ